MPKKQPPSTGPSMDTRPPNDQTKKADAEHGNAWLLEVVPGYTTQPEILADRMAEPGEVVRFETTNDKATAVCRVNVSIENQLTSVVWLLPQDAGLVRLQPLLKACLTEALRLFPDAGRWMVNGTFETGISGELKATTWQGVFLGSRIGADSNRRWVIDMGRLAAAVAVMKKWDV